MPASTSPAQRRAGQGQTASSSAGPAHPRTTHLAPGTQRTYMQPTRFPRLLLVTNTSMLSSSRWEYWKSARSFKCSFHRPAAPPRREPVLVLPTGSGSGTTA